MTTTSRSDRRTGRPSPLRGWLTEAAAGVLVAGALLAVSAWMPPLVGRATTTAADLPVVVAGRVRAMAQNLAPVASSPSTMPAASARSAPCGLCKASFPRACVVHPVRALQGAPTPSGA